MLILTDDEQRRIREVESEEGNDRNCFNKVMTAVSYQLAAPCLTCSYLRTLENDILLV